MIPYKITTNAMRALEFIRDHVTFKLPYDFSYHMKTPHVTFKLPYDFRYKMKTPSDHLFLI